MRLRRLIEHYTAMEAPAGPGGLVFYGSKAVPVKRTKSRLQVCYAPDGMRQIWEEIQEEHVDLDDQS